MSEVISIIVPVFNGEQYIDEALESLCNQTYKNLEIIIVDDGSTDNTFQHIHRWMDLDKRIKLIHQENKGVSAARNVGLCIATGSIIGFVDADDRCEERQFQAMYDAMKMHNADMAICAIAFEYIDHTFIQRGACKDGESILLKRENAIREMYEGKLFSGHLPNKLFRREVIADQQLDEDIAICEDTLFNLRVMSRCDNVIYIAAPLYHYKIHANSSFHQQNFDKQYTAHISYQRMEDVLRELDFPREVIMSCAKARMAIELALVLLGIDMKLKSEPRYKKALHSMKKCYFCVWKMLGLKSKLMYGVALLNPQLIRFIQRLRKKVR